MLPTPRPSKEALADVGRIRGALGDTQELMSSIQEALDETLKTAKRNGESVRGLMEDWTKEKAIIGGRLEDALASSQVELLKSVKSATDASSTKQVKAIDGVSTAVNDVKADVRAGSDRLGRLEASLASIVDSQHQLVQTLTLLLARTLESPPVPLMPAAPLPASLSTVPPQLDLSALTQQINQTVSRAVSELIDRQAAEWDGRRAHADRADRHEASIGVDLLGSLDGEGAEGENAVRAEGKHDQEKGADLLQEESKDADDDVNNAQNQQLYPSFSRTLNNRIALERFPSLGDRQPAPSSSSPSSSASNHLPDSQDEEVINNPTISTSPSTSQHTRHATPTPPRSKRTRTAADPAEASKPSERNLRTREPAIRYSSLPPSWDDEEDVERYMKRCRRRKGRGRTRVDSEQEEGSGHQSPSYFSPSQSPYHSQTSRQTSPYPTDPVPSFPSSSSRIVFVPNSSPDRNRSVRQTSTRFSLSPALRPIHDVPPFPPSIDPLLNANFFRQENDLDDDQSHSIDAHSHPSCNAPPLSFQTNFPRRRTGEMERNPAPRLQASSSSTVLAAKSSLALVGRKRTLLMAGHEEEDEDEEE